MKSRTAFIRRYFHEGNLPDKSFIKKIELPFTLLPDGFATDRQPQLAAVREALVNLLCIPTTSSP